MMYPLCSADAHPEVVEAIRKEQDEDIANGHQPVMLYFTTREDCAECGQGGE